MNATQQTLHNDPAPKPCTAQCLANLFDFEALKQALARRYRLTSHVGVIHIEQPGWEAFIFPYGVFVSWSMSYNDEQSLRAELLRLSSKPHAESFIDHFTFSTGSDTTSIHNDHITLSDDDALEKLAVSHALAQSVKLMEFEQQAQRTIEETSYIPENIALYGRANLGRTAIAKLRGTLYLVRSDIHLHFDLLDTPEFFWEYPERQDSYTRISSYLEIEQRIRLLSDKLDLIHELLNMLADEQNHKHSSTLEWIIIWLIAVEIVIFLVYDILKLF